MAFRFAHEMKPREVLAVRDGSGCAFIHVSPMFEWHSYHLPLGTDGIIAEEMARLTAERVGGLCFRTLSLGLDEWRPAEKLRWWGFKDDERIFGMNFPTLPLVSEYCEEPDMLAALTNRLEVIRRAGFRHVFVVNNHGDAGQVRALEEYCTKQTGPDCGVHFIFTNRMLTMRSPDQLSVGGHAGLSETVLLIAFRPDLADLSELPDGDLSVPETGIHYNKPIIEARWNPRRALLSAANDVRKNILDNILAYIREHCGLAID